MGDGKGVIITPGQLKILIRADVFSVASAGIQANQYARQIVIYLLL
jgi:hypothetical protein